MEKSGSHSLNQERKLSVTRSETNQVSSAYCYEANIEQKAGLRTKIESLKIIKPLKKKKKIQPLDATWRKQRTDERTGLNSTKTSHWREKKGHCAPVNVMYEFLLNSHLREGGKLIYRHWWRQSGNLNIKQLSDDFMELITGVVSVDLCGIMVLQLRRLFCRWCKDAELQHRWHGNNCQVWGQ